MNLSYPEFGVPGVSLNDSWQLFNCSNYPYYREKVKSLIACTCGFCSIDLKVNHIYFETEHWIIMENTIAPSGGEASQDHQFVIPSRRHVFSFSELTAEEIGDLGDVFKKIDRDFGVDGGVIVIRSGNPAKNARSMPHLHVNYHVPTGLKRIEITIAKSQEDLVKKLPILRIFEKMRLAEDAGSNPLEALSPEERELVKGKLGKE